MSRGLRPSPSMIVACIALALALGGTGIAATVALAPNSVGTAQLKNNAITAAKVRNGTLSSADFKAGQLLAGPAGRAGPAGAAGPAGPQGEAGPAGASGPSNAYSRFQTAAVDVPVDSLTTLSSLPLPQAGKYVVWAKAFLQTSLALASNQVTCRLVVGAGYDESRTTVPGTLGRPRTPVALTTNAVVELAAPGSADFKCSSDSPEARASWINMSAIKVANLTLSGG